MHIADLLQKELQKLGSTVNITADSNDIGEQIAELGNENRYVEIIRVNEEKEIWSWFSCQGVYVASLSFVDIDELVKVLFSFLALNIHLKDFFNNYKYITSPVDISHLMDDEEILLELDWYNFLQPSRYDHMDSEKWLIVRAFAQTMYPIAKAKKLHPYRSVDRLCFTRDTYYKTGNFPCICVTSQKNDIPIFTISYLDGSKLQEGIAEEIKAVFEKLI
jgi:hypothetical protein